MRGDMLLIVGLNPTWGAALRGDHVANGQPWAMTFCSRCNGALMGGVTIHSAAVVAKRFKAGTYLDFALSEETRPGNRPFSFVQSS